MNSLAVLVLAVILVLAKSSNAQEFDISRAEFRPVVSDLNAVAAYMSKEELSSADVRIVAAIGCSSMRVAIARRFAQRIGPVLRARYPSEEQVDNIDIEEFLKFEQNVLVTLEVNQRAQALVLNQIQKDPELPTTAPTGPLAEQLPAIEGVVCDLRVRPVSDANQKAPVEETSIARWIGRCIVGLAVIGGDAIVAPEAGPLGAILGMISGGWGWNRCEESYDNIVK